MDYININDIVFVRLNPYGYQLMRKNYNELWADRANPPYPFKLPKEDENGYSKWQLWELMAEFGEYIRLGMSTPFDTEIRLKGDT